MLTEKLNAARMNEQATIRSIRIIDQASQPKSPSSKQMMMVLLGGVAAALVVSFGTAFALQTINEVVETEDDVVRATGLPVLGCIPVVAPLPGRDAGEPTSFLVDGPSYPLAMEACRSVRTSIEFQNSDRAPRTVLVASPGAGEGKSTVLYNLAWAFWETGRRMLVIDADLRRPSLHRCFQIANEIGLVDTLRRGSEEVEANRTVKDGFSFLPSGIEPTNPGALLSSRNMRRLLEMGRERHDMIIIDSPPVLAVSDNMALSSQVDAIVLVVRSGVTRRRNLVRAKQQLDKVRARIVGVVVNGLSPRDTRRYYAEYTHYVTADVPSSGQRGSRRPGAPTLTSPRSGTGVIPQTGSRLMRLTRLGRTVRRPNSKGGSSK
jgi:polysaccharide biosynthesis transport protein